MDIFLYTKILKLRSYSILTSFELVDTQNFEWTKQNYIGLFIRGN